MLISGASKHTSPFPAIFSCSDWSEKGDCFYTTFLPMLLRPWLTKNIVVKAGPLTHYHKEQFRRNLFVKSENSANWKPYIIRQILAKRHPKKIQNTENGSILHQITRDRYVWRVSDFS